MKYEQEVYGVLWCFVDRLMERVRLSLLYLL